MGGKADYDCERLVSLLEGLKAFVPDGKLRYAAGLASVTDTSHAGFEAARDAAADSDVAILALGIDSSVEMEAHDRSSTVGLTGAQNALLQSVIGAMRGRGASRVVVVLLNGGPLSTDFIAQHVPAVLEAFQPGQSGGTAIAEALFGRFSPSGVLPYSVYAESDVLALPLEAFAMRPDPATGYAGRTYRFSRVAPLWPFGHGLSYSTFELTWADTANQSVTTTALAHDGASALSCALTVRNTGTRAAAKVLLLFVTKDDSAAATLDEPSSPLRSLAAMDKVFLPPGVSRTLHLPLGAVPGACPLCVVTKEGKRLLRASEWKVAVGDGAGDEVAARDLKITGPDVVVP